MGTTEYAYDANGNMITRGTQTITWDVENRPVTIVDGENTSTFVYDGNGKRVKKVEGNETTIYVDRYYEKNLTAGVVTSYYYLGDRLVALKKDTTLRFVHQDHLSGTAVITDVDGNEVGSIKYYPYGETRSASGTLETDRKFTGQRLDDTGLYYYNARYYDPTIGRFISADTLVPGPANPQAFNRYSYCLNNPLKYTDPSGHFGVISSIKFAIGMTKLYVSQGAKALTNPSNIQKVLKKAVLPSPKKTASTVERPNNTFNREAIGPSPDTPGTVTDMGKNLPVSSYDDYESPSVVEQIPGYLIKPGAKIMRYGGNVIAVGGLPLLTNPASWGIGYAGSVIGNIGVTMDQYSDALISGEKTRYGEGQDLTDMLNPVGIDRYKVDVEDPLTKLGDAPVYIADTLSDIVSDITSGTADIFK